MSGPTVRLALTGFVGATAGAFFGTQLQKNKSELRETQSNLTKEPAVNFAASPKLSLDFKPSVTWQKNWDG